MGFMNRESWKIWVRLVVPCFFFWPLRSYFRLTSSFLDPFGFLAFFFEPQLKNDVHIGCERGSQRAKNAFSTPEMGTSRAPC